MPKHELVFDAGEYAPVADRITLFYARYPNRPHPHSAHLADRREITVQAFVFRSLEELRPSATGLASERIGDGDVNTVACLENTETSAIGRALANLGLTASTSGRVARRWRRRTLSARGASPKRRGGRARHATEPNGSPARALGACSAAPIA